VCSDRVGRLPGTRCGEMARPAFAKNLQRDPRNSAASTKLPVNFNVLQDESLLRSVISKPRNNGN
jgi:hypothetical protein